MLKEGKVYVPCRGIWRTVEDDGTGNQKFLVARSELRNKAICGGL